MGVLPLDQFLCWKLKTAIVAFSYFWIGSGLLGMLLEFLDIAALATPFEIQGGFRSHWRQHVWEGWLATNVVMIFVYILVIVYSTVMIFAVKRFPTYYEFHMTKAYLALIIIYILVELGIVCYRYSWYGPNTFRLAYLVFTFMYWLIRAIFNIAGAIAIDSRIAEINYEITYGEKKNFDPYSSRANLINSAIQSGANTPMSHMARGQSYA